MQGSHISRASQAGLIPSGPRLIGTNETDTTGYTYLVNSVSNNLELWVQSYPGVGDNTTFYSRKVEMILSSRLVEDYEAAALAVHASCAKLFAPFTPLSSPPTGTTISNAATNLTNNADGAASTCYFNHLWTMNYDTFRNATDGEAKSCGFVLADDMSTANSTFKTLSGRVHVRWTDYYNATVTSANTEPRESMTTWWASRIYLAAATGPSL